MEMLGKATSKSIETNSYYHDTLSNDKLLNYKYCLNKYDINRFTDQYSIQESLQNIPPSKVTDLAEFVNHFIGYPKLISTLFKGWNGLTYMSLPSQLDTVLHIPENGITFFFKNNLYWRSSKLYELDPGYPRLISDNFKGLDSSNGFNGKLFVLSTETIPNLILIQIILVKISR